MTEADGVLLRPTEWNYGWTWPLDQVQHFFEEIWNKVRAAWEGIYGFIRSRWDWINGIGGWIWDRVHNAWDWLLDKFVWLWESIKARLVEVFGALKDWRWGVSGWIWPRVYNFWDWLKDKYYWLEGKVRDWAWAIVGHFHDWGAGVWGFISGPLHNIWDWLKDKFFWLSSVVGDRIRDAFGALKHWAYGVPGWFFGRVYNLWDWIKDKFWWIKDRAWDVGRWISGRLGEVQNWLRDRLYDVWRWIHDLVWAVGRSIHDRIWQIGSWIGDRIQAARDWFASEIVDPWTDYIREIWAWIKAGLSNIWLQLRTFLGEIWHYFLTNIAEPTYNAILGALDWVKRKFVEVIQAFVDAIADMEASFSPIEPGQAWSVFGKWLAYCAAGIGAIALIKLGVEVLHPVKHMGIGHISSMIYQFTNMSRVTSVFVGAILGAQLKIPAEYYFNKVFRPRLPTWAELQGMARKHELSREEFFDAMAYHGFSEDWIQHIYFYMWADPRLYDILRLADVATPEGPPVGSELIGRLDRMGIDAGNPDWWLQMKFMLGGYEDVDIAALTQVVHKRETMEERTRYLTQVRQMYHWGYWDRSTALPALQHGGQKPDQVAYTLLAEDLWFEREILDDKVMAYREGFRRDQLSEEGLRASLSSLIPRSDRVESIVNLERIRKVPRPPVVRVKPPPPLYQQPEGKKRVQAEITRFRGELISEEELLRRLLGLAMPTPEAQATVDLERARLAIRPLPKPPEVPPFYETPEGRIRVHTNRTLYRSGLLEDRELITALQDLEMPTTFAQAVLDDEQAWLVAHPPPPLPPVPARYRTDEGRALLARDKQDYRTDRIDAAELGRRLLLLEMSPELAGAIVDFEELRKISRIPPPPPPPPAYYRTEEGRAALRLQTERFREEEIDKATFTRRLLDLEMTEDQAMYVADYEELRAIARVPPPPPPPPAYYLTAEGRALLRLETERFREGEIDKATFTSRLLDLEMTEDQAMYVAEYEELRAIARIPAPPPPPPLYYRTDEGRARLRLDRERFREGEIDKNTFIRRLLELEMTADQAMYIADYEELRRE